MLPKNTRLLLFLFALGLSLACAPSLSVVAQTPVTTQPPLAGSRAMAIEIATPLIPAIVYEKGSFSSGIAGNTVENYVIITFNVPSTVTKQELGWLEGSDTEFENTGYLPLDTFNELSFRIDGVTGQLILKKATDRKPPAPVNLGPVLFSQPSRSWLFFVAAAVLVIEAAALALVIWRLKTPKRTSRG